MKSRCSRGVAVVGVMGAGAGITSAWRWDITPDGLTPAALSAVVLPTAPDWHWLGAAASVMTSAASDGQREKREWQCMDAMKMGDGKQRNALSAPE